MTIILGQTKAWYSENPETDLIVDIKRKLFVTPVLILFNILFLGVPVVVVVLDKKVFLYNLGAVVIFICCLTLLWYKCGIRSCIEEGKDGDEDFDFEMGECVRLLKIEGYKNYML